ncbi:MULTISPECIES: hypothetical protein [Paenibacillus]|uniref:hypothetical protein n=1 Tax=Paenibacillus TaxID=44249 RepID=UPI00119FDF9B|nr:MULTISPECIES: hypothetical protein [Paenibacillus]MBJ9989258.1 hypothetical protein [Paenibacillus sp. S28]
MFEITGNDISQLSDSDLRSLIGLLCEAELRALGLHTSGVTWGGHQNAKDGGIDVRVSVGTILHTDSFIPRSVTGFQVKKPDMPRKAIIDEMRPNDDLRQVIKELADINGAYIIVSSQGSTSDSSLHNRKRAMQEAIMDYHNASNLKVDFYDRERIASWVRSHPFLILWIRDKIGQPISGWKTYNNWANCPGGIEEEYILDDQARLHNYTSENFNSEGMDLIQGINELRKILCRPRSSVRLVGLSGVGKTRLIQSLFDERIGDIPLSQSNVFYSDLSDSPFPDPRNFAERLIALQRPFILVIDNCPPELHRRLNSICLASNSLLSLITIEYDVKDDQPEETEVFRLEPSSNELIVKLIKARFEHIGNVDAMTIAEISGGNARIAIALARTIEKGEDISGLRDIELFNRLFQQRNSASDSLLKAAEVCSLVYSFDGRVSEIDDNELTVLGSLINMNVLELYKNVAELKRRDLIQQRNYWRALLPHAIANRLAERALENIPLSIINNTFVNVGSERLLKSFSKRLSFLHNSLHVKEIAGEWLSDTGLLSNIKNLNELGINLLINISPIVPELILSKIEKIGHRKGDDIFFSRDSNPYYSQFTTILRSIAYDTSLFNRSARLLCRFALSEKPEENSNSIRDKLKSLFYLYLSGTKATPEQRLEIITSLCESDSKEEMTLGISLLSATLETWHFRNYYGFEFGARKRDYGYKPKNSNEVKYWYKTFIEYTVSLALSTNEVGNEARGLLARKFRGLWTNAAMYEELSMAAKKINLVTLWSEGWLAAKSTRRFDCENMDTEVVSKLDTLVDELQAQTLYEQIKLFALTGSNNYLDIIDIVEDEEDDINKSYNKLSRQIRELGRKVCQDIETLDLILPEMLTSDNTKLFEVGQGIADQCNKPREMWNKFLTSLNSIDKELRHYQLLRGFLNVLSKSDPHLCEEILNEALNNDLLSIVFPIIQTSVDIHYNGVQRIKKSLKLGHAPIWLYGNLAYGRSLYHISDFDFCEFVKLVASVQGGLNVAIDIFSMKIHGLDHQDISQSLIHLGQDLLLEFPFNDNRPNQVDYKLSRIFKYCFSKKNEAEKAKLLAVRISSAVKENYVYVSDYDDLLASLATAHPVVFLDVFLGDNELLDYRLERIFSNDFANKSPISFIDDEIILKWCDNNPKVRYPLVSSVIKPFIEVENKFEWTRLAKVLLTKVPDPLPILNHLKSSLRPTSWSGSRAEMMYKRLGLITSFKKHEIQVVSEWAIVEERAFMEEIRSEKEWELNHDKESNERFEW